MKKCINVISYVLISSLILTGCSSKKASVTTANKTTTKIATRYTTAAVKKDTINLTIGATGFFTSSDNVLVDASSRGGIIKKIYVKDQDVVKKGQLLCEFDTEPIEYDLKSAKLNLQIAQLDYDKAVADGAPQITLCQFELKLLKEQDNLNQVETQLKNAKVTSICDGFISYAKVMGPGEEIHPGETLFGIKNINSTLIAFTSKSTTGKSKDFKIGQSVAYSFKSNNYKGKVVSVPDPLYDTGEGLIYIKPDTLPPSFKNGEAVSVELCLYNKKNVLCIPKEALKDLSNHAYVQVLKDGLITERFITVGLEGKDSIEVVSGLSEGDQVILD